METVGQQPEESRTGENKERIENRILYHGTKVKLDALGARQAKAKEGIIVPDGELLDAIYFTPDKAAALAMGARPYGLTEIGGDANKRTIHFEQPELFDPDTEVYVYCINSIDIPKENLQKIDDNQFAVTGMQEITPKSCEVFKAGDIFKYYRQI